MTSLTAPPHWPRIVPSGLPDVEFAFALPSQVEPISGRRFSRSTFRYVGDEVIQMHNAQGLQANELALHHGRIVETHPSTGPIDDTHWIGCGST